MNQSVSPEPPFRIRDRVRELRRVAAAELKPHPKNWRRHPQSQRAALKAVIEEVGFADALLARELSDGSLELIDGHLRMETVGTEVVPVLIVDLNDQEAEMLLAVHDPLVALADSDPQFWDQLVHGFEEEKRLLCESLRQPSVEAPLPSHEVAEQSSPGVAIPELYQIVVECRDEDEQQALYEQLKAQGYQCRVLTL
jgi:hypothetical protein